MIEQKNFSDKVLEFNNELSNIIINLPEGYCIRNPFNSEKAKAIAPTFYKKYYDDNKK